MHEKTGEVNCSSVKCRLQEELELKWMHNMHGQQTVLIAENDETISASLQGQLEKWGLRSETVSTTQSLRKYLQSKTPVLLMLDLRFQSDGLNAFSKSRSIQPNLPVVILAGEGCIESAITAMKMGALDYFTTPVDFQRLKSVVRVVTETATTQIDSVKQSEVYETRMIGSSEPMQRVRNLIDEVAETDATVLVLGESGTGKELVARHIHDQSRRSGRYVPINITSLPPTLIESGLFGHEKGSFTGADRTHKGWCEMADNGTLFLDEIGEMDVSLQPKLLRFLQEQTVERVGSGQSLRINTRIVAATNRDLQKMVRDGHLRKDLYYRLCVFPIELPPLRDRLEDIPELAQWLIQKTALRVGKTITGITKDALEAFMDFDWPGNIRQLENVIHRMVILSREPELTYDLLPIELQTNVLAGTSRSNANGSTDLDAATTHRNQSAKRLNGNHVANNSRDTLSPMKQIEKRTIVNALERCNGHVIRASQILGLGQATLYRKIKRYGIMDNRYKDSGS